ncbi:DNA-dependent protein kinase catalytic subunit-like [Diachasmimorpha longicaudata]|uniref:DNA-dependent protein kinase catalytic subunit-like n=1 Tax=Diachasmimorpha longicaudata TaxID=58733 RepID=UPI0030B8773A
MASTSALVEIFMRNWQEGNNEELALLFKEGPKHIQNLSNAEIDLMLEDLLHEEALPKYLHDSLDQMRISRDTEAAVRQGFYLLKYLLETFSSVYHPYLHTTFTVCEFCIRIKISWWTRRSACEALISLIRAFPKYKKGFNEFASFFIKSHYVHKSNDFLLILRVLCTIARYHPDLPEISSNGQKYHARILQYLQDPVDSKTWMICLDSLTNVLHNLPFQTPNQLEFCYNELNKFISLTAHADDRIPPTLVFLREHLPKFESFIVDTYPRWYNFMTNAISNNDLAPLAMDSLKVYYEILAQALLREVPDNAPRILTELRATVRESLTVEKQHPLKLRMSIMGYSHMAEPLRILMNDEFGEIFSLISRRILPMYFSEDDDSHLNDIADYQEALARMLLQVPDVTGDQIRCLTKMCVLMIKRYPELKPTGQRLAEGSLKKTIDHMNRLKPHIFEDFLSNVIYEGVVWSCSHCLVIDAELKQDLENLKKRPVTCKEYLPLWQALLTPEDYRMNSQEKVSSEMLTICMNLTSKLDIRIRSKENNVSSNIALSQVPENEDDFRIFLNLVDLYEDLLPEIIGSSGDLQKLIETLVTTSSKHPFLSGFYRLVRRTLSVTHSLYLPHPHLILDYLRKTLKLVFEFPHELQVSCIQLLLHPPQTLIKEMLPEMAPVFTLAFRIGLNNYELADSALEDLERFVTSGDEEPVRALLLEVLPSLEVCLRSKESLEIHKTLESPGKLAPRTDNALDHLQNKILLFFGRISNSVMLEFLYKQSQSTGGTWDKKNLLEYTMTFPDDNLPIHLDTILPRIIELSLCCSDHRTRISACETLYSIVIIVVGMTVKYIANTPERYALSYKTLCPVLLRLGCDPDVVVRQIFDPLMFQITRWLSSKLLRDSSAVGHLVECLFDGLCDESDSSISDFSGMCLAEFSKWSIKQATDSDSRKIPVNIHNLVENIKNFALHPWKKRRVAAAVAFNHVYMFLRESVEIVDVFWLEFLHCFVEAMENCSDARIRDALDHVVRVLSQKEEMFRECPSERRIPPGFQDGTVKGCVEFLLNHCISLDEDTRTKCMDVYERLTDKVKNDEQYMKIQTLGVMKLEASGVGAGEGLKRLAAALDFSMWLLRREFIDPQLLLDSHLQSSSIFSAIQMFMAGVGRDDDEAAVVLKLMDFMVTVLETQLVNEEHIYGALFNEEFCSWMAECVRQPEVLGFNVKNFEMTKLLPMKIENLMETLIKHVSRERFQPVLKALSSRFDDLPGVMNIVNLESPRVPSLQDKLKNLIFMKRCNLLELLQMNERVSKNKFEIISFLFEVVKTIEGSKCWCADLAPDKKLHFEGFLELSLDDEGFDWLVKSKTGQIDELLECDEKSQITHGEHFIVTFKDVFMRYLMKDIKTSVKVMGNLSRQSPDFILFIMNETAIWLQKHRTDHRKVAEEFSEEAISTFEDFRKIQNNFEKRKQLLMNIYRTAVRLRQRIDIKVENKEMYFWIIEEFHRSSSIPEKTRILNDFLICLLDESNDNAELKVMFKSFDVLNASKDDYGFLQPSLATTEVLDYFHTLITALTITKSLVILEAATSCAMKLGRYTSNKSITDHLEAYFSSIPPAKALDSLQKMYEVFLDPSFPDKKPDAVRYFLLPVFKYCDEGIIHDFFVRNIKEMVKSIIGELPKTLEDRQLVLTTRIQTFSLFEIMFSRLSLDSINSSLSSQISEVTQSNDGVLLQLFKKTLDVRKMPVNPEEKFLMRLLHCAAFNCGITMVSVSKEDRYLLGLFGENPKKDQLLWERIIDLSRNYPLSQTFKEFPKQRDVLVSIRKKLEARNDSWKFSSLKSYNLASSTLTEDLGAYDMHGVIPLMTRREPTSMVITLESDDLNDHECMAAIVGLIQHTSAAHPGGIDKPPLWLMPFVGALTIAHKNVQLFLLKVILNTQEVFKPFARLMIKKIAVVISSILSTSPFSYIVADVLLMLVDWSDPSNEESKEAVNSMFDILVEKVDVNSPSQAIIKYNYTIIDMLVKAWHQVLEPPKSLQEKMTVMPEGAIRLVLSLLQNDLGPKLVNDHRVFQFLINMFKDWKRKEEVLVQTSAAIGLFLKFSAPQDPDGKLRDTGVVKIREVFRDIQEPNRLIKSVHAMCTAFPGLLYEFYQFVTHNHLKVSSTTKVKSMELFLLRLPHLSEQDIYQEITYIKFQELLENKVLACEKICLEIILILTQKLSSKTLLPLAHIAAKYSSHDNPEYRALTYDIFMNISRRYMYELSEDESATLADLSQKILLLGLLDPWESLQEKCMTFWTKDMKLRHKSFERILDILDKYSSEVAQDFLPIFGILLLNLSKESSVYKSDLFLPLSGTYEDYKITTSWKMRNLSYRVPLFLTSYASECSQRFTSSSLPSDDVSTNDDLMVRATNSLEFEPTMAGTFLAERNPANTTTDDVFAVPAVPTRFSRRFVDSKSSPSSSYETLQTGQDLQHQAIRGKNTIKLTRRYRLGELPDIQITHEAVINPLQELIKKDPLICKNLMITIISSMLEKFQDHRVIEMRKFYDEMAEKISKKFETIFKDHRGGGLMISVALEVLLKHPDLNFTPETVFQAAKANGLEVLGSLLIEKKLMANFEGRQTSSKRIRGPDDVENTVEDWVNLGELYESISDIDVFLSVFKNHVPGEELNSASSARSRSSWEEARTHYDRAVEKEKGAIRRHCKRGLFECLARLSEWDLICKNILKVLGEERSLMQILETTQSSRSSWMIPWYFKSKMYQIFMDCARAKTFFTDLQELIKTQEGKNLVEDNFTEELAIILSSAANEHARALVLRALRNTKDRWSQLSPLSIQLRLQEVIRLRGLCDTKFFRDALADLRRGRSDGVEGLVDYWERSFPVPKDDLLPWDIHLAQRTHMANTLIMTLPTTLYDSEALSSRLSTLELCQKMALIKLAYHNKNPILMAKYMVEVKDFIPHQTLDIQTQFEFNKIQIKFLRGQLGTDEVKVKNLYSCKQNSDKFLITESIGLDTAIENLQLMSDWSLEMLALKDSDVEVFNRIVSKLIESSAYLPANLQLEDYALDQLKKTLGTVTTDPTPKRQQGCHLKILKYCHNRIIEGSEDEEIVKLLIESTLKAISYGSNEAMNYFPYVLKEEWLRDKDTEGSFVLLTEEIPSWKFLKWMPQLFIHLSSPLRGSVAPIIERLADDYPHALFYCVQSTLDSNPELQEDPTMQKLLDKFKDRNDMRDFVEALEYLVRPELLLKYHLDDLVNNLRLGRHTVVDRLLKKVYHPKNPSMRGDIYKLISSFEHDVIKIKEMPQEEIQGFVEALKGRLDYSIKKQKDSNNLRDYSPYLSQLNGSGLEVPGLYSGESCPDPRYHPRIIKIEGKVQVMKSVRKPIRITIIGDDNKSYNFLVKFGEDLRLDQRLQQVFSVMNEVLKTDIVCSQRNLSIKTFKVIPFSSRLGLIEWIGNAKTLQEFIEFTWNDTQKRNLLEVDSEYEAWISECSTGEVRRSVRYREAVLKRSAEETIQKMKSLIAMTDSHALRRTFEVISPSAESFVSFRRNFITSYSVMSVAQWILGIGDRHLENTMIGVQSGECIGIDFNMAFGGGIDQVIPELMPFRLTKQLLRLVEPFNEGDLISVTMGHVLRAMRNHRGLISGVLGAIVHEQLSGMQFKKKFECMNPEEAGAIDRVPMKKTEMIMRKLRGDHPAEVMVEELREQHFEGEWFGRYEAIVKGVDSEEQSVRSNFQERGLSPEEQVQCLLEQATDLNVLGRTYGGWRPYL